MSAEKLSTHERMLLSYVRSYIKRVGIPPTLREIAEACGLSGTSATQRELKSLERAGYLHLIPNASRGIVLKR